MIISWRRISFSVEEDLAFGRRWLNRRWWKKILKKKKIQEELSLRDALRLLGQCCYVVCPPVPELIARKMAFHPPPKGESYTFLPRNKDEEIGGAKKLVGKDHVFELKAIKNLCTSHEIAEAMETVEPFVVTTKYKNQIVGVRVSPANSTSSRSLYTVRDQVIIFSQPNSSDLGHMLQPMAAFLQKMADCMGVDVYAYDYSGYGFSSGSPSEKNTYADIEAIYDYVLQTTEKRVALVGFSIGTAVTTWQAARKPPRLSGVVLLAPFTSGMKLIRRNNDPDEEFWLDRFRSDERLEQIDVPVLLIHGSEDTVVPVQHSMTMHRKLKHPVAPLIIHGADHQSLLHSLHLNRRIHSFLLFETPLPDQEEITE